MADEQRNEMTLRIPFVTMLKVALFLLLVPAAPTQPVTDYAHVLSPDGSAVTFSAESDLTDRWLAVVTVGIQRDWTWNGEDRVALEISRTGVGSVGQLRLPRSVNPEVFQAPEVAGAPVDRAATHLVFFDAIDPKPVPPANPQELSLTYVLTPGFRIAPAQLDPPLSLTADLPIAAPPTQTAKIASAGVMLSPYGRALDYSSTSTRTSRACASSSATCATATVCTGRSTGWTSWCTRPRSSRSRRRSTTRSSSSRRTSWGRRTSSRRASTPE